jgi:hypothetical protein
MAQKLTIEEKKISLYVGKNIFESVKFGNNAIVLLPLFALKAAVRASGQDEG